MENPLDKVLGLLGSQRALAEKLGVSPQAVQQWEYIPRKHALEVERITDGQVNARAILEYVEYAKAKAAA